MTGFRCNSHRRRGFSLIEMIFAIVIIATLTTLSMPVYTKLRQKAIWVKTPKHMTAIVSGFHDYATEHNEYFPPAYFPNGVEGMADELEEEGRTGTARWLDSTIFAQVYPDRSGSSSDADNTTKQYSGQTGAHMVDTVFLVPAAQHYHAKNPRASFYDMSFCLNRALITDRIHAQGNNPAFSPRKRSLFVDDAATMLIVEGSEGDNNSVDSSSTSQLNDALRWYKGKFIHVGFMDGHVEKMSVAGNRSAMRKIPSNPLNGDESDCLFWTGVGKEAYSAYMQGSTSMQKAMGTYMKRSGS